MTTRLSSLEDGKMTTEHHIALGKINAYFGAPPSGPFAVWAHHPAFAEGAFQLFMAHRHEAKLERSLFELAVIIVARNWSADFVWARHSQAALKLGIGEAIVEAIRTAQSPPFTDERQRATANIIQELTWNRKVCDATFADAVHHLGTEQLVALINAATFYAMVCNGTVAFATPLPERLGVTQHLPPLPNLPAAAQGPTSSGSVGRLDELDYDSLAPAQRIEVAKMRAHFGIDPRGPFQIWAHQAGVAAGAFQLYLTTAFEGVLDPVLKEIVTITVARLWGCEYLWQSHAVQAAGAGVPQDIIDAIRMGTSPGFTNEDQRTIYEVASELSGVRRLSDMTYRRAADMLGEAGLVAVVNYVSFFTMICMTIVAFDPPVPERQNAAAPLPSFETGEKSAPRHNLTGVASPG